MLIWHSGQHSEVVASRAYLALAIVMNTYKLIGLGVEVLVVELRYSLNYLA